MTEKQKVELRLSEVKKELNELGTKADLSDEDRGQFESLKKEYTDLEIRHQALIISDPDPEKKEIQGETAEQRQRAELISRCSVGRIFQSVVEHRASEGAEAELQKELGLQDNQIPLCLIEKRAITPAPANVGTNQDMITPAVFPMGAAEFLGVDMPTVPVGDAVFPVLTSDAAPDSVDESGSVSETTGSFSAAVLVPRRIQASFFYSREDRARFAGMDEALRMNLSDALSSGLDKYILNATGEGLLDFGADPAASTAEETFASYLADFIGLVDGRYAMDVSDVCALVGEGTYTHMGINFRATNSDMAFVDYANEKGGGVRVSAHVPDASSTIQQGVFARGKQYRHAVAPLWEGIQLVPDEVTKAATGEIVLTAVMLMNFKVTRPAGYRRFGFKIDT